MATIVTIQSTDVIANSRADLNTNFANLNSDKIETSYLDTDTTLAANSDSKLATQKAIKAYVDALGTLAFIPVGGIISYAGSSVPSGFLLCDGSAVSRTTYATLFGIIGTTYGIGNGSTTFNLPSVAYITSTNLVSYWKLDESSGNASDAVASNTLTNNNSTAFASGKINNGADFEASSSNYFSIADGSQTGLDITGNISISLWFKPESAPSDSTMTLVSKGGGVNNAYALDYNDNSGTKSIKLQLYTAAAPNTNIGFSVNADLGTGAFKHIVVSFDISTNIATVYVNGVSQGTDTHAVTDINNSSGGFLIGAVNSSSAAQFADGVIDEVSIWSKALSALEVTSLYNAGSGLAYPFTGATFLQYIKY